MQVEVPKNGYCGWLLFIRPSCQKIFPDTPVKHDLFHVRQQFIKTLPKGSAKAQQLCKEFGLIFQSSGDVGQEHTLEILSAEEQLSNLKNVFKQMERTAINSNNGCY